MGVSITLHAKEKTHAFSGCGSPDIEPEVRQKSTGGRRNAL